MRKALLLTLLIGSLAAVPSAHAQAMLESSGIDAHVGALGGSVRRSFAPRMPTQRIAPGRQARPSGATSRSGHNNSPKTIIVHPDGARSGQPAARQSGAPQKSSTDKAKPAAVFLLKNGERIETKQYLLTSRNVQLTADRQQRTIPLSKVDIPKTISTNRERGIELHVPSSAGVVSLDF